MAETEELTESPVKAGALLKQLRNKKNISIQEVASQLRLDPRIIIALEEDDYDIFPADTYIRGYLRNYAKLIGIDGDEIISAYESAAPEPPEIIPDVKHSSQVSSSDKPVKAFTYLITFILVLLLFIWWWQSNFVLNKGLKIPILPETTSTVTSVPAPPPAEQKSPKTDTPQGILDTIPDNSAKPVTPAQPAPKPVQKNAPATTEPATGEAAKTPAPATGEAVKTPAPAAGPGQDTAQAGTTAGDESANDDGGSNKAMPGPDTIHIKLNADCWIEIYDRDDKVVYKDLARKGDELYLNGYAPFKVKLGNAQGVILEYNHKPFDPAPYTTRGIARFTLGEQ